MTDNGLLGPWVRRFLLEYLVGERNLAPNTQKSYRDTLRQLLPFTARRSRRRIDRLRVEDLSVDRVGAFLRDLAESRGCGAATQNQRLAAIHSLAHFIGLHSPEHLQWCGQIRAIPSKKAPRPLIGYLEKDEMDALLAAPDPDSAQGRRDHAVLLFLYNTGARADEAAQVQIADLDLGQAPNRDPSSVLLRGKGSKRRRCPLWAKTVEELRPLIDGRAPTQHVFLNRRGRPLTRFGIHALVERYATAAAVPLPAAREETRESAHDPAHDGNPLAASGGGHQHHPRVAGSCVGSHNQRVRGGGSGDEGEGAGRL